MSYTTDNSQRLTRHQHPSTPKDITQPTSNGKRNGGSNGPSAGDPQDVLGVAEFLTNLLEDAGWKEEAGGDGGHVGEAHEL